MDYPYELIMYRDHYGTRTYVIARAEEVVLEFHSDEHLDPFFRCLCSYLNLDSRDAVQMEDQIIRLQRTNKSLMNLIRFALRKLGVVARKLPKAEREWGLRLTDELRREAEELEAEV